MGTEDLAIEGDEDDDDDICNRAYYDMMTYLTLVPYNTVAWQRVFPCVRNNSTTRLQASCLPMFSIR